MGENFFESLGMPDINGDGVVDYEDAYLLDSELIRDKSFGESDFYGLRTDCDEEEI